MVSVTTIANDIVGVEHEEAGEKWRGGDAAKSLRFFMRAINTYDDGLRKHPGAFDLAYNKCVDSSILGTVVEYTDRSELEFNMQSLSIPGWLPKCLLRCQRSFK